MDPPVYSPARVPGPRSNGPPALAVALLLSLLLAAGCRQPRTPSLIRIAHEADVISLDPAGDAEAVTHSILSNIFESLVAFDRDMKLVPALAATWSTPDEKTWLVELRRGVRFHDGRPLTAVDVKATYDRIRSDPSSGVKGQLATVASVDAVSALSLRITTSEPDPLLLNRLSYVLVAPARFDAARPVGTGPYRFVRWERGSVLEVQAFEDHWRGRPPIDRVEFIAVEEGPRSLLALREGQVDVLRPVPEELAAQVRELPGIDLKMRTGTTSFYLWFDCLRHEERRSPFADRRVRRAVSIAIDRQELVRRVGGQSLPAYQIVQQGVFGHVSGMPPIVASVDEARRLLVQAGYANGFDQVLVHRRSSTLAAAAAAIKAMLARAGVRLRVEARDWPAVVEGWRTGTLPFFLAAWRFESGDAFSLLRDCLFTRDPVRGTGRYNAGFSDPEIDRLIQENAQIFGDVDRLRHYEGLMRRVLEDAAVVPLYHRADLYGVSRRVQWEPRLDGMLLASEMSLVR
jgi:peptide/nickel transport system substrate-binding protein